MVNCSHKLFIRTKSYKSYWSTSGATQGASTTRGQRGPGWARRGEEWGLASDQLLPGITIFLISTISSYEFQNIPIFHNIFKNIPRRGKLDLANSLHRLAFHYISINLPFGHILPGTEKILGVFFPTVPPYFSAKMKILAKTTKSCFTLIIILVGRTLCSPLTASKPPDHRQKMEPRSKFQKAFDQKRRRFQSLDWRCSWRCRRGRNQRQTFKKLCNFDKNHCFPRFSPGDDQKRVKVWSWVEEIRKGSSDGHRRQSDHQRWLSTNLAKIFKEMF